MIKTIHQHCAGCKKRGDTVKLVAGLTAEDRAAVAAALELQFLDRWELPDEEKVCRGCSKRLVAAVRLLDQHLASTPARRLTRKSSADDTAAAAAAEQHVRAAVQVILRRQPAAAQRAHADAKLAAIVEAGQLQLTASTMAASSAGQHSRLSWTDVSMPQMHPWRR